ncbi:MAG: ABC transporter substrate-binding protein [Pseudomonadota bacterium]
MRVNLAGQFIRLCVSCLFMLGIAAGSWASEVPFFEDKVARGELPSVKQRLPYVPFVVDFEAEGKKIGKYGGEMNLLMGKAKDIGQMTVYSYARVVGYAPDYSIQPDIVRSFDVKEGREFTFHLRPGHRWSDGYPLTSEDFRYFWEDIIKHPELGRKGVPSELLVDGEEPIFEVIDALTFRYTWRKPNPAFLPSLAKPSPLYIYRPAHYLKQFHEKYADKAELDALVEAMNVKDWMSVHTRLQRQRRPENPDLPTLQAWRNTTKPPSTRFIFERNPFYHRVDTLGRQLPYIDKVIMSIVSKEVIPAKTGTGESDLQARYLRFDSVPFLIQGEEKGNYKTHLWSLGKGSQIALFPNLNTNKPQWRDLVRDVRFRRALSLAINREEINEAIYFGLASPSANTVMPESRLYKAEYADMWTEFNRVKANELLDEIGLTERALDGTRLLPNGERLEITIESAGESTEETDVLELIADHYREIGVKIFVRASQRDIFRRRAYSGDTVLSVFNGLDNAIPSAQMSPKELAPTAQPQLQWPKWGQYVETNAKAGEPIDLDGAGKQLQLYTSWMEATSYESKKEIWHQMLKNYADNVFSIGTVNNSRQPVVVSKDLRNVPENGIYAWDPTSYFGIYKPDTFWFDR